MNILIINCIMSTAEKGVIMPRKSISDLMICVFARGFISAGHSVTILASEEFRPTQQQVYPFEIVYFKSKAPCIFKPHLLPWPLGMSKYLKENVGKFDLVISSEAFSIATFMASRVCGSKLVIWQEMSLHQHKMKQIPSKLWYNLFTRFLMRKALVVPRSLPAMRFIKRYAKNVSDTIVDHGANGDVLYPSDIKNDAFVVVARLVPGKRVDRIICKFAEFVKIPEYSHYVLDIVGDGNQSDNLKQLVVDLNVSANVIFHGFLSHNDMALILRGAKALLVNTERDLNMVSIPEAIVSGTPIITNTVPATSEYIVNNQLGSVNDDWGVPELVDMAENCEKYHKACIAVRDELTNNGCALKMLKIYTQWHNH